MYMHMRNIILAEGERERKINIYNFKNLNLF